MKKICAALMILAVLLLGCGKERVKPSADSLMTMEALGIIDSVKKAYEGKDRSILKNRMGEELAESISKELVFEKTDISLTPRIVKIDASTVSVSLNWIGNWVVNGNNLENRGVAVFVFVGYDSTLRDGAPMKLVRIEGDNPFQTPVIKD